MAKKKILVRRNWQNFKYPITECLNDSDSSEQPLTNYPEHNDNTANSETRNLNSQSVDGSLHINLQDNVDGGEHGEGVEKRKIQLPKSEKDEIDMAVARTPVVHNRSNFSISTNNNNSLSQSSNKAGLELESTLFDRNEEVVVPAIKRHIVVNPIKKQSSKPAVNQKYNGRLSNEDGDVTNYKNAKTDLSQKKSNVEPPFTCIDAFVNIISIGSIIADIASDIFVAILYFKDGHWTWFTLTVVFILFPAIISTCFSFVWYLQDSKFHKQHGAEISFARWIVRVVFLVFQISPILRYIDSTVYGCKSLHSRKCNKLTRSKYYQEMMYNEDSDAALLRLLECFLEAAPQLTLQLYIVCKHGGHEMLVFKIGQSVACFTSLVSLAWALASYHRSLRFSLPDKANLGYIGMGLQFVWRFFTVGARVLALALFTSVYGYWIFVFCGCHWFIMFIWILTLRTSFCTTKCLEFLFDIVMGIIFIFCFINVVEGHTRLKYLLFYSVIYVENLCLIFGWYVFAHTETVWYLEPALCVVLGGFFLGIFFQIIYYIFFHPNNSPPIDQTKRIKMWVPCNVLCCLPQDENITEHLQLTAIKKTKHSKEKRKHDRLVAGVHTEGQKRMIEMSKHHEPHLHQTLV